jgi:hypothetical protein
LPSGAPFGKKHDWCTTSIHLINLIFVQVWLDSDGGKAHFKSRISFFFASSLPDIFGKYLPWCLNDKYDLLFYVGVPLHWIYDPSNHGKGECDSHGAVVKKGIKLFVLNGN